MLTRFAPLAGLARDLASGRYKLATYVEDVCKRLEEVEPHVQAFVPEPGRRERLLAEAAALEARWPDPTWRPPLFGVGLGVKDVFRVDGSATRAGSELPAELFAGEEALAVTVLREAGALVVGKTHTDEFAYAEPGPTRNPRGLEHTPGGSSAGSAAAVAAGMVPLALGTQTTRSIIGPAAYCGVVGFKPSFGRSPMDGVVPLSPAFDTVGLLTQDVTGMALAAPIICRHWQPQQPPRKPVLGVPQGGMLDALEPDAREAFERQLALLQDAGYGVRRVDLFNKARAQAAVDLALELLHAEMARTHADWFEAHEALYRPRTAEGIRRGRTVDDARLDALREGQTAFWDDMHGLMAASAIDLWVTPSAAGTAPASLERTGTGAMTLLWSLAGLPCISLPAGRGENQMPLGLQLAGPHLADERLLAWAAAIEPRLVAW